MPIKISRGQTDPGLETIRPALQSYLEQHPQADIQMYRYNPYAVRIRVVDPHFGKMARYERHDHFWSFLEPLPEDCLSEITMVALLTPEETEKSIANLEFLDPSPSGLS